MPFEKEWRQPASSIPTNWSFHRLQSLGFAVESSVSWGSLVSNGVLVWILSCSWLLVWILLSSDPIVWILFSCWLLVLRLLSCCLFAWSKGVRSPSILFQLPYQATWIIRLTQSYKARITFALSWILPPCSYPMQCCNTKASLTCCLRVWALWWFALYWVTRSFAQVSQIYIRLRLSWSSWISLWSTYFTHPEPTSCWICCWLGDIETRHTPCLLMARFEKNSRDSSAPTGKYREYHSRRTILPPVEVLRWRIVGSWVFGNYWQLGLW